MELKIIYDLKFHNEVINIISKNNYFCTLTLLMFSNNAVLFNFN